MAATLEVLPLGGGGRHRRTWPDEVKARIVAETFHRAMEGSEHSILRSTEWRPTLGPDRQTFRMVDLLLFAFQRRKRLGRTTSLNLSNSGASVSKKVGRVTVNSRGRGSVRIAKGLSFRFKLW